MGFWSDVGSFFGNGWKKFSDNVLAPVFGSKIQDDGTLKANSKVADFSNQVVKSALPDGASGDMLKDASQFLSKGVGGTAQLLEKTVGDGINMLEKGTQTLRNIPVVGNTLADEAKAVLDPAKGLLEDSKKGLEMVRNNPQDLARQVGDMAITDPALRRKISVISSGARRILPFAQDVSRRM